ncbi:MAG: hypothetical protein HC888_18440 [Candidatus Competibacteraceae bacterium]|nr:hypothetical protein [Candidatus Competibacteraceae bacterium]
MRKAVVAIVVIVLLITVAIALRDGLSDRSPDTAATSPNTSGAKNLDIRLGQGIGPVSFGMERDEVLQALGEPDQTDWGGRYLMYLSRGFNVALAPSGRVFQIEGYAKDGLEPMPTVETFPGEIANGVKIGSSTQDVEQKLGLAELTLPNRNMLELKYPSKGLSITMRDDRVIRLS